jgi:formate hydrogenlyase transcriptional activator
VSEPDDRLELFFSQSLDGFFFMMLDEPVRWDDTVDKEAVLDQVFDHQRITKVNDAMLAQYGTTRDQFLGLTPKDLFRHDLKYGRSVWREFFDRGRLHVETDERRLDGTPLWIEGDYICFYDAEGRITGHFGIQRDITERKRAEEALRRYNRRLEVLHDTHRGILASRSPQGIAEATMRHIHDLVPCWRASVAVIDPASDTAALLAVYPEDRAQLATGTVIPRETFGPLDDLRQGTVQVVDDLSTVPATPPIETLRADGVRSYIRVPLLAGAELIGILNVGAAELSAFTAEHIEIVQELANTLAVAIQQARLREQVERHAAELETQNVYLQEELKVERNFGEILGGAKVMQSVFRSIEMVAGTDSTVLLLGETGTGKELIARAIHDRSARRHAVMVTVNCGALPAGLVESELFGHEKGAFTGATQQKKGRFELAHNGTIFLDEVGELPLDAQVKLLRVLQEQELQRVGSTRPLKVNVRVIAATNRDLAHAVQRGAFRADLYYRLNVFPIHVPPLRERKEDVPLLAHHFVHEFARRMGRPMPRIIPRALERLIAYHWPGNVRELANVLERAVILCPGGVLQDSHLGSLAQAGPATEPFPTLDQAERRHILEALERTGGVLAGPQGAAQLLGINRSTLWSRMRKLGVQPPKP